MAAELWAAVLVGGIGIAFALGMMAMAALFAILPAIVALMRGLDFAFIIIILALVFLTAWTVIGWVVCFFWALLAKKETWGAKLSVREHFHRLLDKA